MTPSSFNNETVSGEFIDMAGERFYVIRNVNKIAPFLVSVVSHSDHWLFVSSTGGLTAGRVSPETALFPYITVDKIHESTPHTGCKTLFSTIIDGHRYEWEPFNKEHDGRYATSRNLYKNILGNKICFEEINHDLDLVFRYCWASSTRYGFVRTCELENLGQDNLNVEMVDGLQNILPAGTPRFAQTNVSNLVDAYKWTELDEDTGLALYALNSGITDRAEPCESLRATTVFSLGVSDHRILLSSSQLGRFRAGAMMTQEAHKRGIRGAYLVNSTLMLAAGSSHSWQLVSNIEQSQSQVVALSRELRSPDTLYDSINRSIDAGTDELARIMAHADAFQSTAEEEVSVHHYANVLFNTMRGGIFNCHYQVPAHDFRNTIRHLNRTVYKAHREMLDNLPDVLDYPALLAHVQSLNDPQFERLTFEYLPITFGRRHGDPSRPWNQFSIRLRDEKGENLLTYEGNWRDIFQNWEALAFSYPEFIENIIAKFVNASTVDGYNPYRITKEGIDWEVEDPDDPWSHIGYWGDHQIIYLLKLLELSSHFHPQRLSNLLRKTVFSYAVVPYRIKPFESLLANAKDTVEYDHKLAERIAQRVSFLGADGKLVEDSDSNVYQVNLLEKLLVTLLCKLGNLVVDAGIWLNTQRPEWNDANNALVGQGLSMVTLYYMRRYIHFLQKLLAGETESVILSHEVDLWLISTASTLNNFRQHLGIGPVSSRLKYQLLAELGNAASRYQQTLYSAESFSGKVPRRLDQIRALLDDALAVIDHSISCNVRDDGLYHAYNLMHVGKETLAIDTLYPMLEGQVAALSSGAISPDNAVRILETLFRSDMYREDQHSFMLYPDRKMPGFLEKNRAPEADVLAIPLLKKMLGKNDGSIISIDIDGNYRFNADFRNVGDLGATLDQLRSSYGSDIDKAREPVLALYEKVFNHKAFTGRSGSMFGFEGLGSIYWHMVSKLLLATQEYYFSCREQGTALETCHQLGSLYYRIRHGIGFNKSPLEYGAFPTDPYSHTPGHAGAQQPGMTGQVKEEILTRYGELGIRVRNGAIYLDPSLLRPGEFANTELKFSYLDTGDQWQELTVPEQGLAFTWCQVPFVYQVRDCAQPSLLLSMNDGTQQHISDLAITGEICRNIFLRNGRIKRIDVTLPPALLFTE
jgi:hypothetical protein